MDKNHLIVLQSDINAQLHIVKMIAETVEKQAIGLAAEDVSPIRKCGLSGA